MDLASLRPNWADFVILAVVIVGIVRGRKRGMSQELLDMLKWFLIVVIAGFVYEPGGRLLAQTSLVNLLYSYLMVYTLILFLIFLSFSLIRNAAGQKLVDGEFFGNAEFYLGMMAGAFRYGCMLLVVLAFLNARYFSPQEVFAEEHYQNENFGAEYFPTLADVQRHVFKNSMVGRFIKDHLSLVLIRPTSPKDKVGNRTGAVFSRHQRDLDDVLAK